MEEIDVEEGGGHSHNIERDVDCKYDIEVIPQLINQKEYFKNVGHPQHVVYDIPPEIITSPSCCFMVNGHYLPNCCFWFDALFLEYILNFKLLSMMIKKLGFWGRLALV